VMNTANRMMRCMKKSTAIVWMLLSLAWLAAAAGAVSLEQTATPNLAATVPWLTSKHRTRPGDPRGRPGARRSYESALTLDADSEMNRLRILDSYTLWNTCGPTATSPGIPPRGQPTRPRSSTSRYGSTGEPALPRDLGLARRPPAFVNVSNGKAILQMDLLSGQTQSQI
jgi:hypothetical protein